MIVILLLGLLALGCQAKVNTRPVGVKGGDAYNGLPDITRTKVRKAMVFGQGIIKNKNNLNRSLSDNLYASNVIVKGLEILIKDYWSRNRTTKAEFIKQLQAKKFKITGICTDTSQPVESVATSNNVLRYRTIDGSYNNLKHPDWGQAGQPFPRILDPDYGNSISTLRKAKSGNDLTNARIVSLRAFPSMPKRDPELSNAIADMAQIVAHDMSLQIVDNNLDNGPVSSCLAEKTCIHPKPLLHESCIPIKVAEDDPFFSKHKTGCLNFLRSIAGPKSDCTISWREQVNTASGYLDASIVYGSTQSVADSLRTRENGALIENSLGNHHLPFDKGCNQSNVCYNSGDSRVNTQVHLVAIQTIYMREHNRIANILARMNPKWDDERLYQEARRILIAEHQHIVYSDLLRHHLGEDFQELLFGSADSDGFTDVYDDKVNGAAYNDFSIAYRTMHAVIPEIVKLCNEARKVLAKHNYSDLVNNVTLTEKSPDNIDNVLRGMAFSHMNMVTRHITSEITTKMLKGKNFHGTDLMMIDIQRGRDHGIPGYNEYREFSGLGKVDYFDELYSEMSYEKVALLNSIYEHPDDIDLSVGGIFEEHDYDSQFGPVIKNILANQFYMSMVGDRFFYTNKNQTYPFTADQLDQIFKVSLSGMICRNSPHIHAMPINAFEVESESNPRVHCKNLPDIDFYYWLE